MLSEKGEELFYKHLSLVDIFSSKLARFNSEKDDLYQQGAIGLIEAIKRYDSEKGSFENYARSYVIGYMKQYYHTGTLIKYNKNNWREEVTDLIEYEDNYCDLKNSIEESLIYKESLINLYSYINKLNNRQKLVMKLFIEGKTIEQISVELNYSRQNIYNIYNSCIKDIKGMVKNEQRTKSGI